VNTLFPDYSLLGLPLYQWLLFGLILFFVFFLLIIFLFGWSIKDVADHSSQIVFFLVAAFALPVGLNQLNFAVNYQSQASGQVEISDLSISRSGPQIISVQFLTSRPAVVTLKFKGANSVSWTPILPVGSLAQTTFHQFQISSAGGGQIIFLVNGQDYLLNHQALTVN
jgi:hypothetical protein